MVARRRRTPFVGAAGAGKMKIGGAPQARPPFSQRRRRQKVGFGVYLKGIFWENLCIFVFGNLCISIVFAIFNLERRNLKTAELETAKLENGET